MVTSAIAPPRTYAEWATVLDMFRNKVDDENVLAAMMQGTIEWQSGVAERFAQRLVDAVNFRINNATDRFQRDFSRSRGQESAIVPAILALRKELNFLVKAINLPVIPEKDRNQYCQLVIDEANKIQRSLEDSAKSDRTGRLSSIIRNNKVNAF